MMKNRTILRCIGMASFFIVTILAGPYAEAGRKISVNTHSQAESIITSPIIISTSYYDIDGDNEKEIIEIIQKTGKLIDGNSEYAWCGGGDRWEGDFLIRVRKGDKVLSEQSLNELFGQVFIKDHGPLSFWMPSFQLVFKDYNNDGQIDFNLGQYGGCAGNSYYLFAINKNGKINRLPIDFGKYGGVYIQIPSHENTTDQIKFANGTVEDSFTDRDAEDITTRYFKWTGDKFILQKQVIESYKIGKSDDYGQPRPANYTLVELKPSSKKVTAQLQEQASLAKRKGQKPFIYFYAKWCPPCQAVLNGLSDWRMINAFSGTYIVKLDIDLWRSQNKNCRLTVDDSNFTVCGVPTIIGLDENGAPTKKTISGSAWNEDTLDNIAPVLNYFFQKNRSSENQ